jgi:two-component system, OmpR family, KDP operon response regulator KdpE
MSEDDGAIIVVEDDPLIAKFMTRTLAKRGYRTEAVTTGAEGLEHAASGRARLLLLDLGLPDMDGLEVLRELRRSGSDLRVVVVTSRSDPADRSIAEELGVSGYIVKPFPLADFVSVVEELLGPVTPR